MLKKPRLTLRVECPPDRSAPEVLKSLGAAMKGAGYAPVTGADFVLGELAVEPTADLLKDGELVEPGAPGREEVPHRLTVRAVCESGWTPTEALARLPEGMAAVAAEAGQHVRITAGSIAR